MTKFKKKPVIIEATQWFKNGDHPLDYSKSHEGFEGGKLRVCTVEERKANGWEGDIVRYFRTPEVSGESTCKHCGLAMHEHGWIDTLEGGHIVCPADWIITGVNGEHYPCKPDIFEKTYEPLPSGKHQQSKSDILKYFTYAHLPDALKEVSKPLSEIANMLDESLPDCAEKSAGLRKLLEAKDCFVRARMENK